MYEWKSHLLDLVFPEHGQHVDYYPGQRATKVDGLVHDEGHDACSEDIVLHVGVPGHPHALGVVERDMVLGDFFEGAPVGVLCHRRQEAGGGVPVRSCQYAGVNGGADAGAGAGAIGDRADVHGGRRTTMKY